MIGIEDTVVTKSTGCHNIPNIIEEYMKLIIDGVGADVLHEINNINAELIPKRLRDSDKNFLFVQNIFTLESPDVSTNFKPAFSFEDDKGVPHHFDDEDEFVNKLKEELDSIGLTDKSANKSKFTTQWILDSPCSSIRNSQSMSKYPCINKLKSIVNANERTIGEMNGCIVNCFQAESSRLRPHADDEHYVNQNASIVTVSLGPTRNFRIFNRSTTKTLKSFDLNEKSAIFMQPGTQAISKHKIMPNNNKQHGNEPRYSISFRNILCDEELKNGIVNKSPDGKPSKPKRHLL